MKHLYKTILFAIALLCANSAFAVYVKSMPVNQIQPSGDTVHFFVTGDEFYHRYHDAQDYTIVQNRAGYWVYAQANKAGDIIATDYLVNTTNPASVGLTPHISISKEAYQKLRKQWDIPAQYQRPADKTSGRNHGDFCNLVIFIRFADDTAYTRSLASVDHMFNDSTNNNTVSLYNYFKKASYNKIFIHTYYAPEPNGNVILSYQDSHPRAFYMPYSDNNPIGYTNYYERTQREFDLLEGAVNWINDSCPISTAYNLDCNNDGDIDNVNFVVKGTYTGWSDLLWPHKFNLYDRQVFINGKRVNTFNFALEGAGDSYFGTSTFCHEMSHSLGAPDLYHYNEATDINPVGSWDLMATNTNPPQHSTAWIKHRYGNWVDTIPLISEPGQYTLTSVADSVPGTMALRFPSSDPNQFYVVEYRDNTELFDTKINGKGLLIYRIDTRESGNADYDGYVNHNEIWIFRPGSHSDDEQGTIGEAYFSPKVNRTEFSPSTLDNYPYLSDGTPDYTFAIYGVTTPGATCSFYYTNHTAPAQLQNRRITSQTATLSWLGNADAYRVYYRALGSNEAYTTLTAHSNTITLIGLEENQTYEWHLRSLFDMTEPNVFADSSKTSTTVTFHTQPCNNATIDTIGWFTDMDRIGLPFANNQKYNYSQTIYLANELRGAKEISTISLHYAATSNLTKTNCTIYLANTQLDNFTDAEMVPMDQLTMVYAGDISFTHGWNEIPLQSTFAYNGIDNLLVALDDNSGEFTRSGNRFYMHSTNNCYAMNYYGTDRNPGPEQDSIVGSHSREWMRPNIKFTGCPVDSSHVYACVISNNEMLGDVSGDGLYSTHSNITIQAFPNSGIEFSGWSDGVTDNPRQIMLDRDTIFVAMFHSPLGIRDAHQPTGFTVLSQGLRISIQGADNQPIQIYDLMGRQIANTPASHATTVSYTMPHTGIYLIRVGHQKPAKLYVR